MSDAAPSPVAPAAAPVAAPAIQPTLLAVAMQEPTNSPGTPDATDAQHAAGDDGAAAGAAEEPGATGEDGEAAGDEPAEEKAPERVAPEKYEFTAPEGTTLDAEVLTEFEGIARELGMPQAEAQALVDKLAPKIAARTAATVEAQQAQQVAQISEQWASEAKGDKEIGGDKLPAAMAQATRALGAYGTPALVSLLEDSRLGNHPEVIRFLARAGKSVSEDTFINGKAPGGRGNDAARVLYPNNP